MANYLKLYAATLAIFLLVDMLWLGVAARSFYRKHLGFILADNPNWAAAIPFYLIFVLGMLVFVVVPGLGEQPMTSFLFRAALYGLVTYAAYDLTNHATLKDWPSIVTFVDLTWGVVVSTGVALASLMLGRWLV